ncbi:MAG TPA: DUF2306 domain-containing protein [Pseudonocardiaceae bacterium]
MTMTSDEVGQNDATAAVARTTTEPAPSGVRDGRQAPTGTGTGTGAAPAWWRRPWMIPLWLIAGAWLLYFVPRYLTFDPARSLVPPNPSYPLHYPLLVGHVIFGTVALVTACLQVWPWLRERHPAVHRWSGRLFVFAGVLPSGILAIAIVPVSFAAPGNAANAILWFVTTFIGFRAIRRRDYAKHRRWMIYSFAVTMQIVWGRALFLASPLFPAHPHTQALVIETASWLGFVVNLLIAQWWIERTADRPLRIPASARTA